VYELSQMQEGMLFHSELEKSSNAYVNQISYDLKGEIDIPKVEMSLNELIKRHDVLRTSFHTDHNRNLQIVVQERPIEFFTNDLSRSTDDIDAQIDQYKEKDLQRGFRLDEDVLMRVALFKKSDDLYTFIWTHHHIIIDGWCSAILISEYTNIYQGLVQDIPYESSDVSPFKNYIKWLRNIDTDKTKRYWKDYLSGFDTLSEVPKKPVSVEGKSYDHKELSLILDQPTTNALANLANSFDVTLNVLIRTIWGYLLGRYNDSEDIVCGAVVSGRPSEIDGIENMVGLFINTIPVRLKWSENTTFQDLLVDTQADSLASESHHYMSLSEIQSHSELKQNLLDHIIVFENYPVDEAISGKSISDTEVLNVDVYEQTSYDFNILVSPGDRLSIKFVFNGEVYSGDLVNRIKSHLLYLITQIIDQPAKRLSEVEIVPLEERDRLTRQSELSEIDTSKMLTIPKQIKFQAQRTPHATALVFKDHHYTFREVDQISNRIADLLIAHRLITKGDIVGVALNRSEWMVFAILGIIKSGAAYLPLDPAHPYERLKYQLEDASVKTVIYEGDILQSHDMRGISLNEIQSQLESFSTDQPDLDISLSDLMYVIYTSGSTGRPKGVAVEYTGVINRIDWLWNKYSFDSKDVLFQKTPYVFDVSVGELFMGLCHGAKTVICPKEALDDTKALWKNIRDHSITTVHFVPSMLNAFLDYAINEPGVTLTGVKRVLTSGEELKLATTKKYYSKFSIPLYNLYGPTEASIEVTFYETRPNDLSVPIGKPISNVDIFVLDSKMRLVPPGVNGMIYIGGIALARGYINDPEKTKGSFFDHPFREGEFLYRTGDIGQWLEEGNVQFLGREDDQIKIRGYRVELSEIENQILTLPSVKNAAVVTNVSSNGDVAIVAYYESSTDIELNDEIKASLEFALPPYMIPQAFVFVEELPLTSSNKIDKKLLSLYDPTFNSKKNIVLPSTELEKRIANIWEEILGHNDLSMNDNFFEIGGHSLKALQLISRIRSDFKIELDLKEIYEFSTLKLLSDEIEKIFTLRKSTHEETVSPEQKEIIL
ncbi:MAG: amino acid adenylation domain-containing protein, partial [Bacteroidota bacterium]